MIPSRNPKSKIQNPKFLLWQQFIPVLLLLISVSSFVSAQNPHILVNDGDKQAVLNKMKEQSWANSIFEEISKMSLRTWSGIQLISSGFSVAIR